MSFRLIRFGLILLLILVFFELILTLVVGVNQRPLYKADGTIEYLLQPNQNLVRFGNNYNVNEYHMRSDPFPDDYYDDNKLKIMVYGDSVINGGTRLDQTEIATSLLQKQLIEQKINAYVGNVSAGSWGPENILEYVKKYGTYKADLAVVVLSSHDAFDIPSFTEVGDKLHPLIHNYSSLYELFIKYFITLNRNDTSSEIKQLKTRILNTQENTKLTELLVLLSKQVPHVIVVLHRTLAELETRSRNMSIIQNSCIASKVHCIDVVTQYTDELYLDEIHLNSKGQNTLSLMLFSEISNLAIEY